MSSAESKTKKAVLINPTISLIAQRAIELDYGVDIHEGVTWQLFRAPAAQE